MPIRPEILKNFLDLHYIYLWEVDDYLSPPVGADPIDSERVYRWQMGQEAIPEWVAAQIYRTMGQREEYAAIIWEKLLQSPKLPVTILLYETRADFEAFRSQEEGFFFNINAYEEFHQGLREILEKLELSDRLMYVPLHRPDYESWLQQTGQEPSKKTLQEWAQTESQKYGSRLEHPEWRYEAFFEAQQKLCQPSPDTEMPSLSPEEQEEHEREIAWLAEAAKEIVAEHDRRDVFQGKVRDRETIQARVVIADDAEARAQFLAQKQEKESHLSPDLQRLKERLRELKKPSPVT